MDEGIHQKDIAEQLGITQGAVSSTFRRARRKLDAYDLSKDNTPDDIVWKLWQIFMRDYELPDFLDVEIEFVIRGIFGDLLPFINWYYSIGELCRCILRYYLFDEDKNQCGYRKNIFQMRRITNNGILKIIMWNSHLLYKACMFGYVWK